MKTPYRDATWHLGMVITGPSAGSWRGTIITDYGDEVMSFDGMKDRDNAKALAEHIVEAHNFWLFPPL